MSDKRKPRDWWSEDEPFERQEPATMSIMDDDRGPVWSGLFDAKGRKLMHERQPFGFRR